MKTSKLPAPRGDLTKIRIVLRPVNDDLVTVSVAAWIFDARLQKLLRGDRNVVFAAVQSHAIATL